MYITGVYNVTHLCVSSVYMLCAPGSVGLQTGRAAREAVYSGTSSYEQHQEAMQYTVQVHMMYVKAHFSSARSCSMKGIRSFAEAFGPYLHVNSGSRGMLRILGFKGPPKL